METTIVDNIEIEKEVYVIADVHSIHYSNDIWGADAEEFKPERLASPLP